MLRVVEVDGTSVIISPYFRRWRYLMFEPRYDFVIEIVVLARGFDYEDYGQWSK